MLLKMVLSSLTMSVGGDGDGDGGGGGGDSVGSTGA